jgi:hypothetical protein
MSYTLIKSDQNTFPAYKDAKQGEFCRRIIEAPLQEVDDAARVITRIVTRRCSIEKSKPRAIEAAARRCVGYCVHGKTNFLFAISGLSLCVISMRQPLAKPCGGC